MKKLIDHTPPVVEQRASQHPDTNDGWTFTMYGWMKDQDLIDVGYRRITDAHGVRIWQSPFLYEDGLSPIYRAIPEGTPDYQQNVRDSIAKSSTNGIRGQ